MSLIQSPSAYAISISNEGGGTIGARWQVRFPVRKGTKVRNGKDDRQKIRGIIESDSYMCKYDKLKFAYCSDKLGMVVYQQEKLIPAVISRR